MRRQEKNGRPSLRQRLKSPKWPSGLPQSWRCEPVRHRANWLTLLVFMLIGFSWGCSLDAKSRGPFGPEDPPTVIPKVPLPSAIVAPHVLEFTGDDAVGHS